MMSPQDGERYDQLARDLADARVEIERLGRCNQHISHTFSGIINQHLHDLVKQNDEILRLRAFRDAVYAAIIENAGAQAAYAYIRQDRWDEIKAAEKCHAAHTDP